MEILRNLSQKATFLQPPIALTIGNFDGLHLGHQAVIQALKKNGKTAVATFENHPSTILRPDQSICSICSLAHKVKLFQEANIDFLLLLPFTKEFSQLSAEECLDQIHHVVPFTKLVLGHDAVIGRNRHGTRDTIQNYANEKGIEVEYIPALTLGHITVSSSKIREALLQGDLDRTEELLGRKYSIYGAVIEGQKHGRRIGFPTANLDVTGLCLPPLGVYAVKVLHKHHIIDGVANLGTAPTIRAAAAPLLEIHLFDPKEELYGDEIEVLFYGYIRPEKRFPTIEALQEQIAYDIKSAKQMLHHLTI